MSIDAEGIDLMTWKLHRAESVVRAAALKRQASVRASNNDILLAFFLVYRMHSCCFVVIATSVFMCESDYSFTSMKPV